MTERRDETERSARRTTPQEVVRVVRIAASAVVSSRMPQMAAALAFRTLFALIPILVISVAIVGAFAEKEDVEATLDRALVSFGIDEIVISDPVENGDNTGENPTDESPTGEKPAGENPTDGSPTDENPSDDSPAGENRAEEGQAAEGGPAAETRDGGDEAGVVPTEGTETSLQNLLNDLVDRLLEIPFGAIGAVGLLTLFYAAMTMLIEIEGAFNSIYRARVGRSWPRRVTQYWTTLTLGAILIFLTFYTSAQFQNLGAGVLGSVIGVAITALFLILAYTTIPNTRVQFKTAAVGALVAAVLFELAKWGLQQYVAYSVAYAKFYGSVGVLPLFMIWVYAVWLIALFGLKVSWGLQHIGLIREMFEEEDTEDRVVDLAVVLPMLVRVGRGFGKGEPVGEAELAEAVGIPVSTACTLVRTLEGTGAVHRIDSNEDRWALSRPPSAIALSEVLEAANRLSQSHANRDSDRADQVLERLRKAQLDALKDLSLADLLDANGELDRKASPPADGPGVALSALDASDLGGPNSRRDAP